MHFNLQPVLADTAFLIYDAQTDLGVQKIGELEMKYYGEKPLMNFGYAAYKNDWVK